MPESFDVAILGSGPAGFSCGIYCTRYNLKSVVVGEMPGGMIAEAHLVENYPGFPSISGIELGKKFQDHYSSLGGKFVQGTVVDASAEKKGGFRVELDSGDSISAKCLVIALGTSKRKLGAKGEDEFRGRGVSYCPTCDGAFFRNKAVAVIGGANAAVSSAVMLSSMCKKVFIVYRKEKLRADAAWVERALKTKNIEVVYKANPVEFKGEKLLSSMLLDTGKELKVDGVFIEIGSIPATEIAKKLGVRVSDYGEIIVNPAMETSVKGVFAAGDITFSPHEFKQVVMAAASGAKAAESVLVGLNSKS